MRCANKARAKIHKPSSEFTSGCIICQHLDNWQSSRQACTLSEAHLTDWLAQPDSALAEWSTCWWVCTSIMHFWSVLSGVSRFLMTKSNQDTHMGEIYICRWLWLPASTSPARLGKSHASFHRVHVTIIEGWLLPPRVADCDTWPFMIE